MRKKTSVIAIVLLIAAAVILGLLLVNKGDGPVAGLIISDKEIAGVEDFNSTKASPANGTYLVLENEFNKFEEKFKADIPEGKDLYASLHFVECSKGTQFTARWIAGVEIVKEETKELLTNQEGIISYSLEDNKVKNGSYKLELYSEKRVIYNFEFNVK